jgi:hypothetical protein
MGPTGPLGGAEVRLVPTSIGSTPVSIDDEIAIAWTGSDGHFTLMGAPPGGYELRIFEVQSPSAGAGLWAAMPVSVAGHDLDNLLVVASRGTSVSGRIEFETDGPSPDGGTVNRTRVSLIGPAALPPSLFSSVEPDGQFQTAEYAEGRYLFRATRSGWLLKSARYHGQDLSTQPFVLGPDQLTDVVVTLTDRVASVAGRVIDGPATAAIDASVLLLRTDNLDRIGFATVPGTYAIARVEADGSFAATGLAAGEYLALAVDDAMLDTAPQAEFVRRLAHVASRLTLSWGQTAALDLEARSVR